MWTLIVIGLAFLGWYVLVPQGEAGETAAAPEAPAPPSAPAEPATDGTEFASADVAEPAPAEAAPAEAPAESGGGDDDPFKAA